jgi:hypothetical protein
MPEDNPRERRNTTYAKLDRRETFGPERQAWDDWLREVGLPVNQVCTDGWVARDPYRNTVSALAYLWKTDTDLPTELNAPTWLMRDEGGRSDVQYGVVTVQLDHEPPHFPDHHFTREERERSARSSLEAVWQLLAILGPITDADNVEFSHQPDLDEIGAEIEAVRRRLDSIRQQRHERRRDGDPIRVGLTWEQLSPTPTPAPD